MVVQNKRSTKENAGAVGAGRMGAIRTSRTPFPYNQRRVSRAKLNLDRKGS